MKVKWVYLALCVLDVPFSFGNVVPFGTKLSSAAARGDVACNAATISSTTKLAIDEATNRFGCGRRMSVVLLSKKNPGGSQGNSWEREDHSNPCAELWRLSRSG